MDSVNLATWLCSVSLTVALPEPELTAPLNEAPAVVTMLVPWGSGLQVLKEKNHFDILCSHVPSDGLGLLLVSLHKDIHTLKNGTQRPFVDVRLEGNVTSAQRLPLHSSSCTPLKPPRSAPIGFPMGHTGPGVPPIGHTVRGPSTYA